MVQYLADRGGEIIDPTGLAVGRMRTELGKGRALTQLLADMEADGMIEREIRGRRTFKVVLKDDWGLRDRKRGHLVDVSAPPPAALEEDELDLRGAEPMSESDLAQLAMVLLERVIRKANEPTQPSGEQREAMRQLTQRLKSAEKALDQAQIQLREALEDKRSLESQLTAANERVTALENNLAVLQKELTRKPRRGEGTGVSIRERLAKEDRALLDRLMRNLPETPQSKPRSEPRKRR